MNPVLAEALAFLAPAATAVKAGLTAEVASEVPVLSADAVNVLENVVAPKLDVPPYLIALAKGETPQIEAEANPFIEHELDLLIARIPS